MKTETITKTFGVMKTGDRYKVLTDIKEKTDRFGDTYVYYNSTSLSYKKKDFALKKAENFVRHMYKDFVNFQDINIHFEFKNCDEIQYNQKTL